MKSIIHVIVLVFSYQQIFVYKNMFKFTDAAIFL